MSPVLQGCLTLLAIVVLIGLRVPVGLVLGLCAFIGTAALLPLPAAISVMGRVPYEFTASWEFSAVPLFLLMGNIAWRSGLTDGLFRMFELGLARLPGGLAVATNFAAAGFGAASGSSLATTVSIGRIAIPQMLKSGYQPALAAGVCACSGTLAALIPPSIPLIVYGILAEQSVARLFFAGIVPGILTAIAYTVMIVLRCRLTPGLAPAARVVAQPGEIRGLLGSTWPLPVLAVLVLGGIYGGWFSPAEAGGVGAILAMLFAGLQGRLRVAMLWQACVDAARTTAVILFIAIGAFMLTRYLTLTGLPAAVATTVAALDLSPVLMLAAMAVVFLVLGMFLDPFGVMLISISVLLPLFERLGYDLIWVGIIVVKYIEIGLMTPPVGLNVFAVRSIAPDISLPVIFKGVL
ncbi:C4-dicarboxylate ABC transporter [Tistrella bauzanensis]|uniref:TRAP transporter large permease protein n=1 Tax=Tistrella bauzanensis TaxID=657419 RepID=A0ABQ1J6V0_9PROT|nr:TRAP transporter large permease subunit [Tistrella bauzanensis]GGB61419.1 C4-dicarboxylate ABC transporter [Tistrella bauzanensis]